METDEAEDFLRDLTFCTLFSKEEKFILCVTVF